MAAILSTLASASTFANSLSSGLSALGDIWNKFVQFVKDGLTAIKDFFMEVWDHIKEGWQVLYDSVISPIMEMIGALFLTLWEVMKPIFEWLNSFVLDTLWPTFQITLGYFIETLGVIWDTLKTVFGWLLQFWSGDISGAFNNLFDGVIDGFNFWWDTLKSVFNWWIDTSMMLWEDIWKPMFSWFINFWTGTVTPTIMPIITSIGTLFTGIWEDILKPMLNWLGPMFTSTFSVAIDMIGEIMDWFSTAWTFVDSNFIQPLYAAFEYLWDILNPIFLAIETAFDMLIIPIKMVLNAIVTMINAFMSPLVSAVRGIISKANKVPGVSISKPDKWTDIPMLAEGGIVKSPTLAVIGEKGPEAVVPLDKMNKMGGPTFNMTFNMSGMTDRTDKRQFAREIGNMVQQEVARTIGGSTTRSRFA